jgi:hypothetical protein
VPLARTAAVAALLAAATASADEGAVRTHLVLHGRFTDRENTPDPTLFYDRAANAFQLGRYLLPQGSDAYVSTFVSAGAEGRHGWFRWGVAADTGELRTQEFPRSSNVCGTTLTTTGIDEVGSGHCNLRLPGGRANVPLADTRVQSAQLTSNGRAFHDELRTTLLLREAWVGAAVGKNEFALLRAGRRRFTVADGFVFDDYGTGVEASFDLGAIGPSFDVGAAAFYPTREFPHASGVTSPMVALRADWLPSLFEHAGLFLAFFRDRTDSVAQLFQSSDAEPSAVRLIGTAAGTTAYQSEAQTLAATLGTARHSDGTLGWLGTSGSLRLSRQTRVDWTGALERGRLTLGTGAAQVRSDVRGQLAWLRVRGEPTSALELSGFFLFLSGDLPPTEKARLGLPERYGGFLGIAPYVTATNIFFQGGVAETFAARQATAPGVNGRGVIAPGLGATFDPWRTVALDARAAYLWSEETGPFGGRTYGPELDLQAAWSLSRTVTLVAEADAFLPGNFFPGRSAVTKVVLGFDVVAP